MTNDGGLSSTGENAHPTARMGYSGLTFELCRNRVRRDEESGAAVLRLRMDGQS